MAYPMTVDAVHTVFGPYGTVQKIAIFEKNGQTQVSPRCKTDTLYSAQFEYSVPRVSDAAPPLVHVPVKIWQCSKRLRSSGQTKSVSDESLWLTIDRKTVLSS